ncbi:MAG TPA: FHA domain-containing protein [Polyangiaceae bacterium]|nr:FHA domain-containing protein [Polyangiaceae bacterium]
MLLCCLGFTDRATAAPEAHILRIDPRTSSSSGNPVITTVIEVQQSKRISQATAECAVQKGSARLACMAQALEAPLYTSFPFPEQNALFMVTVDGTDRLSKLLSVEDWGKSQKQPGVGTAWLILVDADARMGASFADARTVAEQFVSLMGPNDIANVMFFNDRQVFKDSGWLPSAKKAQAKSFVASVPDTVASQGRNRPLLTIIKTAATDGFKALGNAGEKVEVPLHQAMVVLSTGFGGADPSTTGPAAIQLSEYMTNGRFPEDNTALPKTPVPVISIYFPTKTFDEFANNSLEFMQNMANPQIGGFFNVVQAGEGEGRAAGIVNAVRKRFSKMYLVKWRVSCIAPSVTQTFQLVFKDTNPPIIGDATFKNVPIGIDPTTWPLDVNVQQTQSDAGDGVYPGGKIKVYGDFCWGGDKGRAEVYFVPAGQALPADLSGGTPEQAKQAQQQLVSMGMRGEAISSADGFAEFQIPDNEKLIHGSGSAAVARLLVYDNVAHRMSAATAESIVTVKARTAPFPLIPILGGAFGLVVIALVLVVVLRGGGKNKRRAVAQPGPSPAGYPGAPAGGYGAAPGYGASPYAAPPAPVHNFGPAPVNPSRAVLQGSAGVFTVVPGMEMRVGRDAATCAILLNDGQVSSFHASVKLENGTVFVRDENSNNGTFVQGTRIAPGQWVALGHGSSVRFGPGEFGVRLE